MKTSVLDFIDSATLREHLRDQKLEPAVECILIIHSKKHSIEEKLDALKERYETYSTEDFNMGKYNCREIYIKAALKEYIISTKKVIDELNNIDSENIYHVCGTDDICCHGLFNTFDHALNAVKKHLDDTECTVIKAKINEFENVTDTTVLINELGLPYDIWNLDNDRISWSIYGAYAWIPHRYAIGDLIRSSFDATFAVVVDNGKCPTNALDLDINDMTLKCVAFEKKEYHSCGGIFIQRYFPILRIESATAAELEECPKELIRFSHLVKGGISPAEFLEEYGQGIIGSKL
jgi:hypothetical protein